MLLGSAVLGSKLLILVMVSIYLYSLKVPTDEAISSLRGSL